MFAEKRGKPPGAVKNFLMNCPIRVRNEALNLADLNSTWRSRAAFIALAFSWCALSLSVHAQDFNTAVGDFALNSVSTGDGNTAIGYSALFKDTGGSANTASGYQALFSNTGGNNNTATGAFALQINSTGKSNTATGEGALFNNTTGGSNTATGADALSNNKTGSNNTATGVGTLANNVASANTAYGAFALMSNTVGIQNTATGFNALLNNTNGSHNTANGFNALLKNTTGSNNTATGQGALNQVSTGDANTANGQTALNRVTTGSGNIGLGFKAGFNVVTGSNNIDIGNVGVLGDTNTIRIGAAGTQTTTFVAGIFGAPVAGGVGVLVNSSGKLGQVVSSVRFKEAIKPMDQASESILSLQPVTFRYKHELDPDGTPQFGLVAEEVERVNPDLVVRGADGKVMTVRYEAVNAMLLNEFLKEHKKVAQQERKVQEQEATINQLKSIVAQQQKEFQTAAAHQQEQIEALTAGLQKVSSRLELNKPSPRRVADN
jgi:uncharacterized coiled-coil protein SlyX